MAHKSKKKHIKHLHQHETASMRPKAKAHPGAKADVEADRIARPRAAAGMATASNGAGKKPARAKKRGIVRRIAKAATKKIAARPKRIIERATSRVKSMLGGD